MVLCAVIAAVAAGLSRQRPVRPAACQPPPHPHVAL